MAATRTRRKRTPGRPSKIADAKVRRALIRNLENGLSLKHAALAAGLDESTLHRWLASETPPHDMDAETFDKFREDITRARSAGAATLLADIAANDDWRAKAWILERRMPDLFGKVERIEHTGRDGGPIHSTQIKLDQLPDHLVEALVRHVRGQGDDGQDTPEE